MDLILIFATELPATILAIMTVELFIKPMLLNRVKTVSARRVTTWLLGEERGQRVIERIEQWTGEDWTTQQEYRNANQKQTDN